MGNKKTKQKQKKHKQMKSWGKSSQRNWRLTTCHLTIMNNIIITMIINIAVIIAVIILNKNNIINNNKITNIISVSIIALCVFGKRGPKMFNFELLFLHGFSSKNRGILHKAVLTPQEYEDYFFGKQNLEKNGGKNQKTCWGCL